MIDRFFNVVSGLLLSWLGYIQAAAAWKGMSPDKAAAALSFSAIIFILYCARASQKGENGLKWWLFAVAVFSLNASYHLTLAPVALGVNGAMLLLLAVDRLRMGLAKRPKIY